MNIQENVVLAPYTTFHIGGPAKFFCLAQTVAELTEAVTWARQKQVPIFILGGGSNSLVSDDGFPGLVIHFVNKGLEIIEQTDKTATIKAAAGEVWDDVVALAVQHNFWGVENLSHIPGLVGGFVVQNIGAYGQDASEVIDSVEIFDLHDQELKVFTNVQCHFSYRRSIFNTEAKSRFVIISTTIILNKTPKPNLSYGDLKQYLADNNIAEPTQQQIREAVTAIRDQHFPFPTQPKNGNAGSFFRGPILKPQQIEFLFQKVGENLGTEALKRLHLITDRLMVAQGMKTPTGFLIELCGLRGTQVGGAKVHDKHGAIVINETGQASAKDVIKLFTLVGHTVYQKTGVILHIEPELVGFSDSEKEQILDSVVEG